MVGVEVPTLDLAQEPMQLAIADITATGQRACNVLQEKIAIRRLQPPGGRGVEELRQLGVSESDACRASSAGRRP